MPESNTLEYPALGASRRVPLYPALVRGEDESDEAFAERTRIRERFAAVVVVAEIVDHETVIVLKRRQAALLDELGHLDKSPDAFGAWLNRWRELHGAVVTRLVRGVEGVTVGGVPLTGLGATELLKLIDVTRLRVDIAQAALRANDFTAEDRDFFE